MDVQKFELCEGPVESIEFPPGSVPVHIAAKVYGRDSCWEMDSRKGRIAYYISPRKLWEDTGYVWKGER